MHICVCKIVIIGVDICMLPDWWQAIFWTTDGLMLIAPCEINLSEILIKIYTFSLKKMSSVKWQLVCLSLNVLTETTLEFGGG